MKKIFLLSLVVFLYALALNSCKKDVKTLDTGIQPVTMLSTPSNDTSITIDTKVGISVVFKWSPPATQGLVLYEIAFDKAGGDFSNPVYKVLSDGKGVQTQATISQKTLNNIASLAGIAALDSGTVKWAVIASKQANSKIGTSRTLKLKRPAGFAVNPNAVYLTGSATEGGTDVSKALPFKKVSDGVFELYTSLQPGTYSLIDNTTGTPTTYSISGDNILLNGETTVTGSKTVYRISLDFGNAAATMTQIVSVGLYSAPDNTVWFTLPYTGNSQWEADGQTITIPLESYGLDSRYKYQFTVKDEAGNQSIEWYGAHERDNPDPSASTPLSYFYMYPTPTTEQFDYCFKILPSDNGKKCNVNVNYSPGIANYTNSITPQ